MLDILLAQAIQQPNWVQIGQSQSGARLVVDENSFRTLRGQSVRFRSLQISNFPESDGTAKIATTYLANCSTGSLMASGYVRYDSTNQVLSSVTSAFSLPMSQGSVTELFYKYACSRLGR